MTDNTSTGVYLALGTNLGDRLANLAAARQAMPPHTQLLRASSIYQTPPWGFLQQPAFLNQVVEVETGLPPLELIASLKQIEKEIGRTPTFQNGPRVIDIDILLYGSRVFRSANLSIPHPRMQERAFVLVPLAELAPGLRHPVLGKSIRQLLTQVDPAGVEVFHGETHVSA